MASLKIWISAFRLRTLPLALSATILGSCIAAHVGDFKWEVLILGMITTLFLQILSNLANDYGDAKKGTDNEKRIGPQRLTQAGIVSEKEIRGMIFLFIILSFIAGIALIYVGLKGSGSHQFLLFLLLGIAAIAAAIKYTIGKRPYGYAGLGDIMVFLFFGIIGVAGTYYLHTNTLDWSLLLPASAIGLFSAGVLNLNNLRDRENDKENGKITMVVKLGLSGSKVYHVLLLALGFTFGLIYNLLYYETYFQFLFILVLPLMALNATRVIRNNEPSELNSELKRLAFSTLMFSLLFGLGLII